MRGSVWWVRAHFLFWLKNVMSSNSIDEQIQATAARLADENNLEFVHAEIAGTKRNLTVRIFIDKEGGVTIDDCSDFSRKIEAVLDADDLIPTAYTLEISSPGLERELYSLQDFVKYSGNLAKVKTKDPINGQKNFRGKIVGVKGEEIIFADKTNGEVSFPYNAVAKANLEIDLEEELKGKK